MHCRWNHCKYTTLSLYELYEHSKTHAIMNLGFVCKWNDCNKRCFKKARLWTHMLTHIPYRGYICKVCNKGFKRDQELQRHLAAIHEIKAEVNRDRISIEDLIN